MKTSDISWYSGSHQAAHRMQPHTEKPTHTHTPTQGLKASWRERTMSHKPYCWEVLSRSAPRGRAMF